MQLCGTVALGIASHFPLTAFNIVASLVLVLIPVIGSFHNLYCDIVQSREIVLLLLGFSTPGTALRFKKNKKILLELLLLKLSLSLSKI